MIIDSHAHVFPFLGGAPGFSDPTGYFAWLQFSLDGHHQPVRRVSDNALVPGHTTWSPDDLSPAGRQAVDLRVGRFGRFEWTVDGVDYYKQYLPPSLRDNACSDDYLVAEMDYAGVDVAVLQNDLLYGKLNDFFAACARRYPGRFLLTAHVDETALNSPGAREELLEAAGELGHHGLFVSCGLLWLDGFRRALDHRSYDPFWAEVERLGLVVYWSACELPGPRGALGTIRWWCQILDRHPGIPTVMANGLPRKLLFGLRGPLPAEVSALLAHENICLEVLLPISRGAAEEYPYEQSLDAVRYLYDVCGPRALVWGSDIPNVLRHCTYTQSLDYLRRHATFIPEDDMSLILGGNLARLFRLDRLAGE